MTGCLGQPRGRRRLAQQCQHALGQLVRLRHPGGAGLLQQAKVIDIGAGVAMIWVFPLLCLIYGIAKMILTRRYL